MGFVKLNADASFDQDLLRGMTGMVLRDHKGNFIAGGDGKIEGCADILAAKALTLRFGLALVQKGRMQPTRY